LPSQSLFVFFLGGFLLCSRRIFGPRISPIDSYQFLEKGPLVFFSEHTRLGTFCFFLSVHGLLPPSPLHPSRVSGAYCCVPNKYLVTIGVRVGGFV